MDRIGPPNSGRRQDSSVWFQKARPLLEVKRLGSASEGDDSGTRLDPNTTRFISGIFQGAADLLVDAGAATRYRLVFSPETMRGMAEGTYRSVVGEDGLRAWAIDARGRFVEHGFLQADQMVRAGAVACAAWQVLAIVTAQAYLSRMNRQLAALRVGVEDISQFLDEEQRGKLLANLGYLADRARSTDADVRDYEWLIASTQLEQIERESRQIFELYRGRLAVLIAQREDPGLVRPQGLIGVKTTFWERVSEVIEKFRTTARVAQIALLVRAVAVDERCSLGGDIEVIEKQSESLSRDLEELCTLGREVVDTFHWILGLADQKLRNDFRKPFADHPPVRFTVPLDPISLVGHLAIADYEKDRQKLEAIRSTLQQAQADFDSLASALRDAVQKLREMVCRRKSPLVVEVTVSPQGDVSALRVVDEAA